MKQWDYKSDDNDKLAKQLDKDNDIVFTKDEIYRDIPGYEGLYKVSNLGNVINKNGILKKPQINKNYYRIQLSNGKLKKNFYIHKLVSMSFLNHIPNGMIDIIDHIDGNKFNNDINNLRITDNRNNCSICFRKNSNNYSSKYIGVTFDKSRNKYKSSIYINGKHMYLGRFNTEIEAYEKYKQKLIEYYEKEK